MIQFYSLIIVSIVVTLGPLCFGILACSKFRNQESQPRLLAPLMGCITIGCAVILYYVPSFPILVSISIVSGTMICGIFAVASILCGIRKIEFPKALLVSAIALLPLVLWIDLRFRVVVRDSEGRAIEVRNGSVSLHHPPESYFQSYVDAKGLRLKKGTVYFGLIRWLQYKDRWSFPGTISDRDGKSVGDLKWESARWSQWPKVFTAE
jgi:hypothetical protein